jgi:hypothetical protein
VYLRNYKLHEIKFFQGGSLEVNIWFTSNWVDKIFLILVQIILRSDSSEGGIMLKYITLCKTWLVANMQSTQLEPLELKLT